MLAGAKFDALRDVAPVGTGTLVTILSKAGRGRPGAAAGGRAKSSSMLESSSDCGIWPNDCGVVAPEAGLAFSFRERCNDMSEAGVAGPSFAWDKAAEMAEGVGAAEWRCGPKAGDCIAEAGLGGGPIRASESASGEMDSVPELSANAPFLERPADKGRERWPSRRSESMSLAGMTEDRWTDFRFCIGLTMGDWRTRGAG